MKRQTDEDAYPEARLRALISDVLETKDWGKDFELVITPRKGRSERVTLVWPDKSKVSIVHRSRKPGLARAGMAKLLTDLKAASKKTADQLLNEREDGPREKLAETGLSVGEAELSKGDQV